MSSAGGFAPGGLWSLWDMLSIKASAFYNATVALREINALIGVGNHEETSAPLDADLKDSVVRQVSRLALLLKTLDAKVTLIAAKEHLADLTNRNLTYDEVADAYADIERSLRRELSLVDLLVLRGEVAKYFEPSIPLFGDDFTNRFNSTGTYELEEAGKCLALNRPTAAVFHLMRIMEVGIRAMAKCLDIPDPLKPSERNWGHILKTIRDEGIAKKWPDTASRMGGDGHLFEALHASLDAVKNPWRNGTMHVEQKYTDEEARHIFDAVRGFMMRLSSRMDEDGLPKA